MSACYKNISQEPHLYLFARGMDKKRFVTRIRGFAPYFYVPWNESNMLEDPILDFKERAVAKLRTTIPGEVKKLRDKFSFTDEADVEYEKRVLTDLGVYCGFKVNDNNDIIPTDSHNISPHYAVGDIEVLPLATTIMPVPTDARHPVVSIGFLDSYTLEKVLFILKNEAAVDWPATKYEQVVYCSNEHALFKAAADWCKTHEIDLWTGWFWQHYDVAYLYYRSKHINFPFTYFSPIGEVRVKPHPKRARNYLVKIGGLETTDLLIQYRTLTKPEGKKLTWDLKFIVKEETKNRLINGMFCKYCEEVCTNAGHETEGLVTCKGFTYTDYGDKMGEVYGKDHVKLIKYGFNDIIAAYLVDQMRGITDHFDTARRLRGCFISDAHSAYSVHRSFLLRLTSKPLPTNFFQFRDKNKTAGEGLSRWDNPDKVPGAYVKAPIPGIHENIANLDITAIYPMLIENLNTSPETISENGTLIAANGTRFSKSPLGLFPKAVRQLRKERDLFKAMKDALHPGTPEWALMWTREQAAKYDVRSFYGATRNVDTRVTAAVTTTGKMILEKKLIPFIERKLGYTVVYGDTDSVHIKLHTDNWEEGLKVRDQVNEYFVELSKELNFTEPLNIKYEEFFSKIFYHVKKRWAGYCTVRDGKPYNKLIIMGLQAKRSDSALVTIATMKQFMLDVNIDGNKIAAMNTVKAALAKIRTIPIDDIGIPKGLSRDVDTYKTFLMAKAVKWSTRVLGIKFRQDKRPKLIYGYVEGYEIPKLGRRKTVAFAFQDGADIQGKVVVNYKAMIKRVLESPFKPLMEAIGLDWESVVGKTQPSQLTQWCKQ